MGCQNIGRIRDFEGYHRRWQAHATKVLRIASKRSFVWNVNLSIAQSPLLLLLLFCNERNRNNDRCNCVFSSSFRNTNFLWSEHSMQTGVAQSKEKRVRKKRSAQRHRATKPVTIYTHSQTGLVWSRCNAKFAHNQNRLLIYIAYKITNGIWDAHNGIIYRFYRTARHAHDRVNRFIIHVCVCACVREWMFFQQHQKSMKLCQTCRQYQWQSNMNWLKNQEKRFK